LPATIRYPGRHRFALAYFGEDIGAMMALHVDRLDEAREIVARLRAITPDVMPPTGRHHVRNPEQREFFLPGLRLAASEEA
jgi:hypothetical protein